jgi:hypothetical protein
MATKMNAYDLTICKELLGLDNKVEPELTYIKNVHELKYINSLYHKRCAIGLDKQEYEYDEVNEEEIEGFYDIYGFQDNNNNFTRKLSISEASKFKNLKVLQIKPERKILYYYPFYNKVDDYNTPYYDSDYDIEEELTLYKQDHIKSIIPHTELTCNVFMNLIKLNCDNTFVKDVNHLTNLRVLSCSLTDVSDISKLVNLTELTCNTTRIIDVNNCVNLVKLTCINTNIFDISKLTKLLTLKCENSKITDLSNNVNLTIYSGRVSNLETVTLENKRKITVNNVRSYLDFKYLVDVYGVELIEPKYKKRKYCNCCVHKDSDKDDEYKQEYELINGDDILDEDIKAEYIESCKLEKSNIYKELENVHETETETESESVEENQTEKEENETKEENQTKEEIEAYNNLQQFKAKWNVNIMKNIRYLNCSKLEIYDVHELTNLVKLTCSFSKVRYVNNLVNLTELYCFDTDITKVDRLVNLTELDCGDTLISDISNLSKLKNLICSNSQISNINNLINLEGLHCAGTENLVSIKSLPKLSLLYAKYSQLTYIEDLPELTCLSCIGSKIANIGYFPKLTNLNCGNELTDINHLTSLTNLVCIDNTNITDISNLTNLKTLYLDQCNLLDLSNLTKLEEFYYNSYTISNKPKITVPRDATSSIFNALLGPFSGYEKPNKIPKHIYDISNNKNLKFLCNKRVKPDDFKKPELKNIDKIDSEER